MVQQELRAHSEWDECLKQGKMFGVLVVEYLEDTYFLAAYSGLLAGENHHPYFVPPVCDLLAPDGFFKPKESYINHLNRKIKELREGSYYTGLHQRLQQLRAEAESELAQLRAASKTARARRSQLRQQYAQDVRMQKTLDDESRREKSYGKQQQHHYDALIRQVEGDIREVDERVAALQEERRKCSALLQQETFEHFVMLNAHGESKNLIDIFAEAGRGWPPAGTAECAAPKLLQYAYQHGYRPLAIGEFWWGSTTSGEVRRAGAFYPACNAKCAPTLHYMLQGLEVEQNRHEVLKQQSHTPQIVYQDQYLVVIDKPTGMLTIPGKGQEHSVLEWARQTFAHDDSPFIVHRLDMETSGLLVIALNKACHKMLQQQFLTHDVRKRYEALLTAPVHAESGIIRLPLAPDLLNRPLQRVDYQCGKMAITAYKVIGHHEKVGVDGAPTRVSLIPMTGRTHQLRVHAAHPDGLNAPIIGDNLYGQPAQRLCLHACYLSFVHPVTGKRMVFESSAPF